MPRFFFHVYDGVSIPDIDGTELADLASARVEAVRLSGALLTDHAEDFWGGHPWSMEVTDRDQMLLFTLNFSAALAGSPPHPA